MIEKKDRKWVALGMFFFMLLGIFARAAEDRRPDSIEQVSSVVTSELAKLYPGARVELTGSIRWIRGNLPSQAKRVRILFETGKGEVQFIANEESEGVVSFAAWMIAWVAVRRVHPGEHLSRDSFVLQEVNVSSGMAHEYRGVILSKDSDLSHLEARQTILEGQFALTTGVQKIPDVRRGEALRIKVISGDLILSTQGIAEEPAYLDQQVRVMTTKTKRDLVGKLCPNGEVEVKL